MRVVKVHCGSAHVKGRARNYPYYIASVFEIRKNSKGEEIFYNTGISTPVFRSLAKAERYGRDLANQENAIFIEGYGSLHNLPVMEVSYASVK